MFDRIAPRYDALNRLLTGRLDQRWRRAAIDAIDLDSEDVLLDLACGTGDFCEIAAASGARTIGTDFAREMLRAASRRGVRAALLQGDAAQLPIADASVTVVTCGFALRNFVSIGPVVEEMARVLKPAGRIVLIDVDRPSGRLLRAAHSAYFDRVVPAIGGLLSDRAAYAYLPQSTSYLPPEHELARLIEDAGFESVVKRQRMLGAAQIWTGVRSMPV